ncbi:hypothetical protein NDA11_006654 [Ustilago hordei]|nr:hypothetical protein NDA11_006654 [Ustilago hordei]UTT88492.1 hypothetical protein NDA17_003425 [Ustilago hordei]
MICEDQTANKIWKYLEWSVNKVISNIEHIANKRAQMGHPVNSGMKLGCLLCGVQPHLHLYTAACKAQWESIALSKASNPTEASSAELKLKLKHLFNTAAMGLHNYKESAHLKEQEVNNVTLVTQFTNNNQSGYQHHQQPTQAQNQQNPTRNQVTCWNCDGTAGGKPDNGWIWDTGADVHICKDELIMTDLQHINGCIQQAQGHSSMTLSSEKSPTHYGLDKNCIDASDHSKVYISRDVRFNTEVLSDAIMDINTNCTSQNIENNSPIWDLDDNLAINNVLCDPAPHNAHT